MKTQINEIKRMQQLAGIKPLYEADNNTTPEQAAQQAIKIADKLENNSPAKVIIFRFKFMFKLNFIKIFVYQ